MSHVSSVSTPPVTLMHPPTQAQKPPAKQDSDGDNDGSTGSATSSSSNKLLDIQA